MRKSILVFLIFLIGCSHVSTKVEGGRGPNSDYSVARKPITSNQQFSFQELKQLLVYRKVKSIEELLKYLSENRPDYLRFHTLMHSSLSLHESSFTEPRAIVFGTDAKFVITFNGGHHQRGGDALEVMEFSPVKNAFEFREIIFKKVPGATLHDPSLGPNELEYNATGFTITKPNPTKCLNCHSQNASPIWGTYFLWPGAYGANDDNLQMYFDRGSWNPNNETYFSASDVPTSQGRLVALKKGVADKEVEGYISYLSKKPGHGRYKWLPEHVTDAAFLRYSRGESAKSIDLSKTIGAEYDRFGIRYWPSRPNLVFLDALISLNGKRIISRLSQLGVKKGEFAKVDFGQLHNDVHAINQDDLIPEVARTLDKFLKNFEFKNNRPTLDQIQNVLLSNLREEIGLQREKMRLHEQTFGKNSLQLVDGYPLNRLAFQWIKDPESFYAKLLNLKRPIASVDQAAFAIESDDQVSMTAIYLVLKDRGLDLHDYNMNLRGMSLSFNEGGFSEVSQYLFNNP